MALMIATGSDGAEGAAASAGAAATVNAKANRYRFFMSASAKKSVGIALVGIGQEIGAVFQDQRQRPAVGPRPADIVDQPAAVHPLEIKIDAGRLAKIRHGGCYDHAIAAKFVLARGDRDILQVHRL